MLESMSKIYCKEIYDKEIYCNLNPLHIGQTNLSKCGISIMMDDSKFIREPDVIIRLKGKIHNSLLLCKSLKLPIDTPDESIIIHLYKLYGIEYTLQVLTGIFAFVLFDYDYKCDISKVYTVRDPFGIIPFYGQSNKNNLIFSDENTILPNYIAYPVDPGTYTLYELSSKVFSKWEFAKQIPYYHIPKSVITIGLNANIEIQHWRRKLYDCIKTVLLRNLNNNYTDIDAILKKWLDNCSSASQSGVIHMYGHSEDKLGIILSTYAWFQYYFLKSGSDSKSGVGNEDVSKSGSDSKSESGSDSKSESDCDSGSGVGNGSENVFEFDINIRNRIRSMKFGPDNIIYPFFDTEFVAFYFSIPLNVRYMYHKELFR